MPELAFKLDLGATVGAIPDWLKLVGVGAATLGGGSVLRSHFRPKTVRCLYDQVRFIRDTLKDPILPVEVNPYAEATPTQAVIFKGRNKAGKTTRLCTAIPWWRRFGPFATQGIYFNGAKGTAVSTFDMWVTTQMFGQAAQGGAEVEKALDDHASSQRLRNFFGLVLGSRRPAFLHSVPAVVVVDQLEELMKRFPVETLGWVNQLTNAHVRDNKARVIFVVNSDYAVKTIQALNQGDRWKVVPLTPPEPQTVRDLLDEIYFEGVQRNIGLYKEAKQRGVEQEKLAAFANETLDFWEKQFHVPYPLLADKSWRRMDNSTLKATLLRALEEALRSKRHPDGDLVYTDEKVLHFVDVVKSAMEVLDNEQVLAASAKEWEVRLVATSGSAIGEGLAKVVKALLGNPAPDVVLSREA